MNIKGPDDAVSLREIHDEDLDIFYSHQLEKQAVQMAAFTKEDPADREQFEAHWKKVQGDQNIILRTILFDGAVAGHIAQFELFGEPEVSYWIGMEYWGKGVATQALKQFLEIVLIRPLFARAASDNIGSMRVLEKCGFKKSGTDKGFANARGKEIVEFIFRLD